MFLARNDIRKMCLGAKPIFYADTFAEECLQQASYDLRLGRASYLVGSQSPKTLDERDNYLTIPPGQFALLTCFEKLDMPPNLLGFITLKNSFKMQGLINISGFHVDPSFQGNLIFAVNNAGPSDIRLRLREPTFTIFFADVKGDVGALRQNKPLEDIPLSSVQYLGGSSVTLTKLQKELEDLRSKLLTIYAPLAVATLIALLLNLLKR
jgi:dCTP deaminase